jgi:hypothetical protein
MKQITSCFLIAVTTFCHAQSFSGRTNEIVFNFKNTNPGLKTNLPMIKWVTPKQEYSSTQGSTIEIEAIVTSDVDIKSLKMMVAPRGAKSP